MSLPNINIVKTEELYNNDPKLKKEDVGEVLKWVQEQPHLPEISELQAILFLSSCHYSIEATQITIENFFTSRTQNRFLFQCPTPETIQQTFTYTLISVIPERTADGCMILYFQLTDPDIKKYISLNQIQLIDMALMLNLFQYGPATGLIVVMESSLSTIMHITKIHLVAIRKMLFYIQEAIPVRIKGLHFFSVNYATGKFISLIKPFLKKELADMIISHKNNPESLKKFVPVEFIPEEWGGSYKTLAKIQEDSLNNFLENIEFFQWEDTQLIDESKRVKKSRGLFGYFWG